MERLTERTADGIVVKEDYGEKALKTIYECYGAEPSPHYANCAEGYCAMEKLSEYEDMEEQVRLVKLPCAIGDTIFECVQSTNSIVEHTVKEFIIRAYRFPRIEIYCENESGFLLCDFQGNLDEYLYLTQEQAEQALARMGK